MNRYVKLFVIICVFVICTGCSFTKKNIDVLITNDCCESNNPSWISNEIKPETIVQEEFDNTVSFETHSNSIDLLNPPFYNRTLENPNKEWNESDIFTAWNLTDASKVYIEYTDRLFCDIDNDLSFELILTSYSTKKMYFFKKTNNEVEILYEFIDIDITNGNIFIPPTDKETIEKKEVYDFQDCNLFKLYNNDGNVYVSGISWRSAVGKTCWIKKLIVSNDDITFVDVFRWGMFTKNDRIASEFEYRRYDCNGNYSHTTQQEINDFLLFLDDIPYNNNVTFENETIVAKNLPAATEDIFESQDVISSTDVSTENLTDSYSEAESSVTENKTVSEYEDIVQRCIIDVRDRNPLEVIDTLSYDIDNDGDNEKLLLLEGAIFGNSRTLYVYKIVDGDIQPCGDIWALQSEICDDIFNPSAHFHPYNEIKFGKLSYNDCDYDCIICYSIRKPYYHGNYISQVKIDETGEAVEVLLLRWGLDIMQKYNGLEYIPIIYSYLDDEEKEISNEDLNDLLSLIKYDDNLT